MPMAKSNYGGCPSRSFIGGEVSFAGGMSDGGERTIKVMTGKTAGGATERAIKHGTLLYIFWPPFNSNSNTRIGEHADPWGQELASNEAWRLNLWKNDRDNSGWGHGAIKHRNIC